MPNEHRADPTPPPHHGQGWGGSKMESFSLRVSPALHPPERPSPRRADMAGHGLGRETGNEDICVNNSPLLFDTLAQGSSCFPVRLHAERRSWIAGSCVVLVSYFYLHTKRGGENETVWIVTAVSVTATCFS